MKVIYTSSDMSNRYRIPYTSGFYDGITPVTTIRYKLTRNLQGLKE